MEAREVASSGGGVARWQRGRLLGKGAFGQVYQALNLQTGGLLAVKLIEDLGDDGHAGRAEVQALENEVNMLRRLEHVNIVRYLGWERSAGGMCIFLEFVAGGSLCALVEQFGPLQETVVKVYTRQLLLGLEYLHSRGVAHRDIKGANVLVAEDGTVKLADFGASKRIWAASSCSSALPRAGLSSPCSSSGTSGYRSSANASTTGSSSNNNNNPFGIKGTAMWMAPEVIREDQSERVWRKADLWSVGCTVIEMCTGKPPWSQFSNPVTAMYHIACGNNSPEVPEALSEPGKAFLAACFQQNPMDRPDVTAVLLFPFVSGHVKALSSLQQRQQMRRQRHHREQGLVSPSILHGPHPQPMDFQFKQQHQQHQQQKQQQQRRAGSFISPRSANSMLMRDRRRPRLPSPRPDSRPSPILAAVGGFVGRREERRKAAKEAALAATNQPPAPEDSAGPAPPVREYLSMKPVQSQVVHANPSSGLELEDERVESQQEKQQDKQQEKQRRASHGTKTKSLFCKGSRRSTTFDGEPDKAESALPTLNIKVKPSAQPFPPHAQRVQSNSGNNSSTAVAAANAGGSSRGCGNKLGGAGADPVRVISDPRELVADAMRSLDHGRHGGAGGALDEQSMFEICTLPCMYSGDSSDEEGAPGEWKGEDGPAVHDDSDDSSDEDNAVNLIRGQLHHSHQTAQRTVSLRGDRPGTSGASIPSSSAPGPLMIDTAFAEQPARGTVERAQKPTRVANRLLTAAKSRRAAAARDKPSRRNAPILPMFDHPLSFGKQAATGMVGPMSVPSLHHRQPPSPQHFQQHHQQQQQQQQQNEQHVPLVLSTSGSLKPMADARFAGSKPAAQRSRPGPSSTTSRGALLMQSSSSETSAKLRRKRASPASAPAPAPAPTGLNSSGRLARAKSPAAAFTSTGRAEQSLH